MNKKSQQEQKEKGDFRGAAIINQDGSETPITEEMVREACDNLEPVASEIMKARHTSD